MVYLNPFDLGSGFDFFPHAICITCFYRTFFSSFHSFAALFVYCAHLSIPCHSVVSLFALFPIGICIMVVQLSQCIAICAFQYRFGYKIREGNLWPMAIFKFFFFMWHNITMMILSLVQPSIQPRKMLSIILFIVLSPNVKCSFATIKYILDICYSPKP